MKAQRDPRSPYVKAVRPMEKSDIESLRQPSARERIQNLKDVHHIIARLIVSGLSLTDIAAEVGYSLARVSVIKNSPAMEELIARYRGQVDESWQRQFDADAAAMTSVRRKSLRIIEDYLDDHVENPVPIAAALKAYDSTADRSGFHRKTAKENININFAASLEEAIHRSRKVIEGDFSEVE